MNLCVNIGIGVCMLYSTEFQSPIGLLTLASDGRNLLGLWVEGQKYFAHTITEPMMKKDDLEIFVSAKILLDMYFAGEDVDFSEIPLAPKGSDFRQKVWRILCTIPYGEVITYGDITKEILRITGKKSMSSQAIGGAVGHNPISIIIPCHRVVGTDGSLKGFASGIENKIRLLDLEGVDLSDYYIPEKAALYRFS